MIIGINTVSSQSGRAYFADLLQRGYVVQGYARESSHGKEFVNAVNDLEGIFLDRPKNSNGEMKKFLNIDKNMISHDLKTLVEKSDYIILSEPSHYFIQTIKEMKINGLAERKVPIILSPSRSFSTPYIWKELGEMYPVICFSTCPYSCKAPRPDTAYIKRRKRNWLASLEGNFSLSQIAELGQIFPQAIFNSKPITTSIGNIGAIFHPSTYLLNYDEITMREKEGRTFSFYMEGIAERPEVGKVLEKIDQMRLEIASKLQFGVYGLSSNPLEEEWKEIMANLHSSETLELSIAELRKVRHDGLQKLNYSIPSCQHWLDYTYGVKRIIGESLSDAIRRTPTYQKNSVPQKRYVEEDIATGLIPLTNFAKRLGIDTRTADQVLDLCDKLYPNRNRGNDRTLNEFTDEYLKNYLTGKYFAIID
jgi:hypothetical protein